MTDIDASAFANPARQPSPETCRRAALTVCRSALGAGGSAGEVRDVLEHLGCSMAYGRRRRRERAGR